MQADPINWQHILIEAGFVLAPTLGGVYLGFRKVLWLLGEFRPHKHDEDKEGAERDTALTIDGLTYPRSMNGRH